MGGSLQVRVGQAVEKLAKELPKVVSQLWRNRSIFQALGLSPALNSLLKSKGCLSGLASAAGNLQQVKAIWLIPAELVHVGRRIRESHEREFTAASDKRGQREQLANTDHATWKEIVQLTSYGNDTQKGGGGGGKGGQVLAENYPGLAGLP